MSITVLLRSARNRRSTSARALRIAGGLVAAASLPILFSLDAGCTYHAPTCTDDACLQDRAPNSYQCACQCEPAQRHRELRVSAGADDVEQRLDTSILTNSPDLDFLNGRWVGLRFGPVAIPPGSGILHAYVQFVPAISSAAAPLTIQITGVAADDAPVFSSAPNSLATTPATGNSATWDLSSAWPPPDDPGANQLTPDFATVLQEIVDRPQWAEGNAIGLLFHGTAGSVLRQAFSQEGRPQAAPLLIVEYLENLANQVGPQNLPICVPPDLNANLGGAAPSEDDLRADCQGRVQETLSGLAQACKYPSVCSCDLVDGSERFAGKCDAACVENPVDMDCADFDPVHGNVQATNAAGDIPVCIANSPLSAALFGRRTTCTVTGNAHVDIDGHTANPHTEGVVQFTGDPVPGQSGAVGIEYRLDIDSVTFGNFFHSETFTDLAGLGASQHGSEALLSATGDGTFGEHTIAASGQGRRGSQRKGLVSMNQDGIDVHVGWGESPPMCAVTGALVGTTDPEAARCENAGPNAGAACTADEECGEDPACSDGICNCEPIGDSNMLLSLDVAGEIVNSPPTANAGADQTIECKTAEVTNVTLDASGSSDLDDNLVLYSWLRGGRAGAEVGYEPIAHVEQSLGTETYVARVIDQFGEADEDATLVEVVDTTPPVVSCSVALPVINQTNHDLIGVGLAATAVDQCEGALPVTVRVFADEDDEEDTGDGRHSPDARNVAVGSLRLRAERKRNADGRVYLIIPEATDSSQNRGFSCCTVTVPYASTRAAQVSAASQAAAALHVCANTGAAPTGFVLVGDGPVIGNKQ